MNMILAWCYRISRFVTRKLCVLDVTSVERRVYSYRFDVISVGEEVNFSKSDLDGVYENVFSTAYIIVILQTKYTTYGAGFSKISYHK